MSVQNETKAAVTVAEMARMCWLVEVEILPVDRHGLPPTGASA